MKTGKSSLKSKSRQKESSVGGNCHARQTGQDIQQGCTSGRGSVASWRLFAASGSEKRYTAKNLADPLFCRQTTNTATSAARQRAKASRSSPLCMQPPPSRAYMLVSGPLWSIRTSPNLAAASSAISGAIRAAGTAAAEEFLGRSTERLPPAPASG